MLNAQQVIDAIHGSYQTGSKNGHQNVLALLEAMHVTMKTPVIHVAGTNGKGSTCAMTASILRAAGYKVGLYTSPFLQHYQERIRLNGVPLTDELMIKYGNPLVAASKALGAKGDFVTPFEMGTALAFAAFEGKECDVAVVEVGMGGRLDPTNIFGLPRAQGPSQASRRDCQQSQTLVGASSDLVPKPIVCAITAIGLDHMGFLGDTLEEIAGEKAGIIKPNTPVVCYPAQESVRRVFRQTAEMKKAPLLQLDESMMLQAEGDMYGSTVTYRIGERWENMRINLPGQYQQRNAMTVLALVEELRRQGYVLPEEAVRQGLAETIWPARLEWAGDYRVLIDGAHNPQGVDALVQYVDEYLSDRKRVLLSGVLADKLQPEMLGQMVHIANDIVTVTPDTPRAMAASAYADHLNAQGGNAQAAASLSEGLKTALEMAGEDGIVIAAGSLYFAGALRTELNLAWR